MKKKLIAVTTAFALSIPLANAVVLNPRGTGQVLLYPYYTVNGENNTLLTIGNMSDRGKAVKVRFLEGRNGRTTLDFNVYLAPYDVWTSAIFSLDKDGSANLITDDNSCTVPFIKNSTSLPKLPDQRSYVPFMNFAYTVANNDAGPDDLSRTREGSIEIIEMGSIVSESVVAQAVTHNTQGIPNNCTSLSNAWMDGGFWKTDTTKDLANPTGGLFGNAQIINVAAGTMLSYNATALEEFRQDPTDNPRGTKNSVVMHGTPGGITPNLSNALTDPSKNLASASVMVDGKLIRADYPADKQAIDAVSAVLMANTLSNDFVVEPTIGAQSEWIVAFPTKRFYTDEAIVGNEAAPPFSTIYPACFGIAHDMFDRERLIRNADDCIDIGLPPPEGGCPNHSQFCFATQAMPFTSALDSSAGWLRLNMTRGVGIGSSYDPKPSMRPALDGTIFHGLPVIGFLATNYVNSNVQNGVLANYSGTFPHRTTVKCTKNGLDC